MLYRLAVNIVDLSIVGFAVHQKLSRCSGQPQAIRFDRTKCPPSLNVCAVSVCSTCMIDAIWKEFYILYRTPNH